MTLETLKDIKKIDGFNVVRYTSNNKKHKGERDAYNPYHGDNYVIINDENDDGIQYNSITFNLQNGPIREVGKNGCRIDTLIEAVRAMVTALNKDEPSENYEHVLQDLNGALYYLDKERVAQRRRDT